MAASILAAGPAYRVMTESNTYNAITEGTAVAIALSISQSAQCEVRVLDEEDNIILVTLLRIPAKADTDSGDGGHHRSVATQAG